MRFSELENSRVAILGTGREGLSVWRQLRKRFPTKHLSLYTESVIPESLKRMVDTNIDHCFSGAFSVEKLKDYDVLVRSAGISPYRKELQELRKAGCCFTSATNLWFSENPEAKTICITGTMGKSTTAALTSHLLEAAGLKVSLAGNIGRPMLDCETDNHDWWVIELSSYQISDLLAQPDIAVLLNLSEEHIDWHKGVNNYQSDKLRLAHLVTDGRIVANYSDDTLVRSLEGLRVDHWFNGPVGWQAEQAAVSFKADSGEDGVSNPPVGGSMHCQKLQAPDSLPGEHNMQNLAAALTIVDVLGLKIPQIETVLASFTGLPHRLQLLGVKSGIRYVNDSISTTPVSVSAALQTMGHEKLVLLLGGLDRGLDWKGFALEILDKPPYAIIAMPDSGADILACFNKAGVEPEGGLHEVTNLREAVKLARSTVPENGVILLSPGAPSFPHFRDFEDRGEQFRRLAGF